MQVRSLLSSGLKLLVILMIVLLIIHDRTIPCESVQLCLCSDFKILFSIAIDRQTGSKQTPNIELVCGPSLCAFIIMLKVHLKAAVRVELLPCYVRVGAGARATVKARVCRVFSPATILMPPPKCEMQCGLAVLLFLFFFFRKIM